MDVNKLIAEIDLFSNRKLKKKEDLKSLVEVSVKHKKEKQLEILSFNAKYLLGLQRVLKKGSNNPEISNLEDIKRDYSTNLIKSVEQIKELIDLASAEIKNHFNNNYFELSHSNLQNLNELFEDLEWVKMYFNRFKRTNPI